MFYCFNQNNSGGRFHADHADGISHYVIVEGTSVKDIIKRAKNIGLYFNGCRTGRDCSCCGDRWYEPWDDTSDGDDVPKIYGEDVSSGVYKSDTLQSIKDGPEGYIHYMDGTVQPVVFTKVPKTRTVRK